MITPSEYSLTLLKNENLFLTGGGGVGKSYTAKKIISDYKNRGKNVVVVASTGVAAVNIGGQTVHSVFGFGISNSLEELVNFDRKSKRLREIHKLLKATQLLVIDEISMISADLLDMVVYRLRSAGFEGRVLIVGDFCQLPPVVKSRPVSNNLFQGGIFAFESEGWNFLSPVIVELTKIHRTDNEDFAHVLNRVRRGENSHDVIEYLRSLSGNTHILGNNETTLYGTNNEANMENFNRLGALDTPAFSYQGVGAIEEKFLHEKRFQSWRNSLPVDDVLNLKIGVPVIFTTNKHGSFYNGERGIVTGFEDNTIFIETKRKEIRLERNEFVLSEYVLNGGDVEEKTLARYAQFPIRVAFAITIHKSQGMGIENLVCNVNSIFTDSQFYVAVSRGTSPNTLCLQYNRGDLGMHLRNIIRVSPNVLRFYENQEIVYI